MGQSPPSDTLIFAYIFSITLGMTVAVYLLRGLRILTFIPGGLLSILILLSISSGIIYGILKTRR